MKTLIALFIPFLLVQCEPPPQPEKMKLNVQTKVEGQRFSVELVGKFEDWLAYDNERGLYIIKDSLTGREYIGVSGIGISELGSHSSGKVTISDER